MADILVSNIVRYTIHDGAGVRTTVFLKGCSMHCHWCANPETINPHNQYWFKKEKCIGKENSCFLNRSCCKSFAENVAGREIEKRENKIYCPVGALEPVAKWMTQEELYTEIVKDRLFWGSQGGVTFSGGEPLLQFEVLLPVLTRLKNEGINMTFETAGNVSCTIFAHMLEYANYIYLDIKNVLPLKCKDITGLNLSLYLRNLRILDQSGVAYSLRFPLIKPYTLNEENIGAVCEIVNGLNRKRMEIFSCHNLAETKRLWLGCDTVCVSNTVEQDIGYVRKRLIRIGADVFTLEL